MTQPHSSPGGTPPPAVAAATDPPVAEDVRRVFDGLLASREVQQGLAFLKADEANTLAEQKAITMIPAPPFKEQARAGYCLSRFAALGLEEVRADKEGNVIGVRPGNGGGPKLVVSAHLDTVFPEGTELKIVEEDGRLFAPGIGDDARGLAEVLSLIRAFNATGVKTAGDLHFVCTVGEEGLGDLRGVKALFRDHQDIDGFISIDGPNVARVTYLAAGSHRYRVTFKGPGGHSFNEFRRPSAIHAMGRAIAGISELRTPAQPKTTFTVGTVRGGTSVNAIAGEAVMEVDMRSVENPPLLAIEAGILKAIRDAVAGENARWGSDQLSVEIELVGDRPAGAQPLDSPIMQGALAATRAVGVEPAPEEPGSTDSNLPISLGVPAVTLGRGGKGGSQHSRGEWFDATDAYLGPQRDFLVILALAGVEGVSAPVLPKRPPRG